MATRPLIGLALPQYERRFPDTPQADYFRLRAIVERAESLGFDSVWLSDHFFIFRAGQEEGALECWTTLAALAEATTRVKLGTLVVCNPFRSPGLIAKMAATVDQISYGRLILGLGAGWHEPEFEEFGYEFEPPSVRVDRLRESVQIVRALLTGEHVTFDGQFYQLRAAALRPTPVQHPRPPIWVAARGQRMMQLTADYADGWNIAWQLTPQQYQAELERLLDAFRAVGRDSSEITKTLGIDALIGRSEHDLEYRYAELQQHPSGIAHQSIPFNIYRQNRLVGIPDAIVTQIQAYADAGVEHLILNFGGTPFSLLDLEQIEVFAEQVLPRI